MRRRTSTEAVWTDRGAPDSLCWFTMVVFDVLHSGEPAVFVEIASRASVIVSWRIRPTNEDLSKATVNVSRGYSPQGPFVSLADVAGNDTVFRDAGAHLRDKWRGIYYKLRLTSPDSTEDETKPVGLRTTPELEAVAIRKRLDLLLRFSGTPSLIYSRIHEGTRCPDCWDAVLKKVRYSNCLRCFNTGRLGGYYYPVLTQVRIDPVRKMNEPGDTLRQVTQTTALAAYFPIFKPQDLIYEVNAGERWRVVTSDPTEKKRSIVHQDLSLVGLNPGDIEHKVPIPGDNLTPVIRPRRNYKIFRDRPIVRDFESLTAEEQETASPKDVDFFEVYT